MMTPYAAGTAYINFMPGDEANRVEAAYGKNYKRLQEIKRSYDPEQPVLPQPEYQAGQIGAPESGGHVFGAGRCLPCRKEGSARLIPQFQYLKSVEKPQRSS